MLALCSTRRTPAPAAGGIRCMLMLRAERGLAPAPPVLLLLGWGCAGPPGLPATPTTEIRVPPPAVHRVAAGLSRWVALVAGDTEGDPGRAAGGSVGRWMAPHPPSRPRTGFTPGVKSNSLQANGILLSGANPAPSPWLLGGWCQRGPAVIYGPTALLNKQGAGEQRPPTLRLSLQVKDGPCDGGCRLLVPARALPPPHRRPG